MPASPPVIETARLRLREPRLADKDDHIAMWADARVTRFIGGEPRAPDVSWGKFLSSAGLWPVMGFGYWVFADKAEDRNSTRMNSSHSCASRMPSYASQKQNNLTLHIRSPMIITKA